MQFKRVKLQDIVLGYISKLYNRWMNFLEGHVTGFWPRSFSFPREYPFFASKFVMYIDNVLSTVAICKFVLANAALRRINR